MLTTTLDGLWVLQVLTGLESLAPELGLRPYLPHAETRELAVRHPVADDLRSARVIGEDGGVDPIVVEWLTVLARREVSLLLYRHDQKSGIAERLLLARFAHWWVSIGRCGSAVEISDAGMSAAPDSTSLLIQTWIEKACGRMYPACLQPVTLCCDTLLDTVRLTGSPRAAFSGRNVDADQAAILGLASDSERSTHACVVAIHSPAGSGPARSIIDCNAVTIIDTPRGRLLSERICENGKTWVVIGPGSGQPVTNAVMRMITRPPVLEN